MNLSELKTTWRIHGIPKELDNSIQNRLPDLEKNIKKENISISYWMASTIYITGIVAMPFILDDLAILFLGAIWFLVGLQAFIFWGRQFRFNNSFTEGPLHFIDKKIKSLKCNLMVTNLFMPMYTVLLAIFSLCYLYTLLDGLNRILVNLIAALLLLFYLLTFIVVWRRRRKKDAADILPLIKNLNKLKADYKN